MKKLLLILFSFLFAYSIWSNHAEFLRTLEEPEVLAPPPPDETHVFTTYDTTFTVAGTAGTFRMKVTRPTGLFGSGADTASRPLILFVPGQGQMGTSYTTLDDYGPHALLASGAWDGGITLSNGIHYPIVITLISSNTFLPGSQFGEALNFILGKYHIKRNSVHISGWSQGAFATSSSIYYERVAGDEFGMRQVTSLFNWQGRDEWPDGYPNITHKFVGKAWGRWAKQYDGRYLGIQGTSDPRFMYEVKDQFNDSGKIGNAYLGYENIASGAHNFTGSPAFDPSRTNWRSVTPYGTNMQAGERPTTLGTYKDGNSILQWMLRQGDTTIVGATTMSANAGGDVSIIIPTQPTFYGRRATYNLNGKTLSSVAWTRISGPNTPTLAGNTTDTVTIGNGATPLIAGTYVYRFTVVATDASTATSDFTLTVTQAVDVLPTITRTSTDPQTLTTSTGSFTFSHTAGTGSNTLLSTQALKPGQGKIVVHWVGSSTLSGQGSTTYDSSMYARCLHYWQSLGLVDTIYRTIVTDLLTVDISTIARAYANTKLIIFDFPSNNINSSTITAVLAKYKQLKDTADALSMGYAYTGTGPNNSFTLADRMYLKTADFKIDSANTTHVIRFYGYATDTLTDYTYRDELDAGDFFHGNNTFHRYKATSIIAFNPFKFVATSGATITNGTTASVSLSGMADGTSVFIASVKDGSGRSAYTSYTKNVNPVAPVRYNWNTATATITVNRTNYPTMKAGDTLYIAKIASGTGYSGLILDSMRSEITYPDSSNNSDWIHIVFAADAYMAVASSDNQASYMFGCHGLKIRGYKALDRNAMAWRLGRSSGVNTNGHSNFIWIDSAKTVRSMAFENSQYSGFPKYLGDTINTFHHWYVTRTIYQNTYPGNYTAYWFKGGSAFGDDAASYWRDIGFKYCVADTNYAGESGGSTNGSGGMIAFLAVSNLYVHNCSFAHMGMANYPSAHSAVITVRGTWDIQDNWFGPENHANDVRCQSFDMPSWGSRYTQQNIFANNISVNKRKYPVVEHGTHSSANADITAYRRIRYAYGIYNNLLYRGGEGARGAAGAAVSNVAYRRVSVLDALTADSVYAKNNIVVGAPRDSLTDIASVKPITTNGALAFKDTSNNLAIIDYLLVAWVDTLEFKLNSSSALKNKGALTTPLLITNAYDYYRHSRVGQDTIDVGPTEYLPGGNITPVSNAGSNQTIQLPLTTVTLNGSGSDADGSVSHKAWTFISGPATPSITSDTLYTTGVTGLTVAGTYVFRLTVTDNTGATSFDEVNIVVNPANQPPVADAGVDQSLDLGVTQTTLSGTGNDFDGTITGYNWIKVTVPTGDASVITNASPTNGTTTVTGLIPGDYTFRLTVTDNQAANGSDDITIHVYAAPGNPDGKNNQKYIRHRAARRL